MQTGKWQLIRVTLFARARVLIIYIYLIPKRNMASISKHLRPRNSPDNKGINPITHKVNRVNLIDNAETERKNISHILETFSMAMIERHNIHSDDRDGRKEPAR